MGRGGEDTSCENTMSKKMKKKTGLLFWANVHTHPPPPQLPTPTHHCPDIHSRRLPPQQSQHSGHFRSINQNARRHATLYNLTWLRCLSRSLTAAVAEVREETTARKVEKTKMEPGKGGGCGVCGAVGWGGGCGVKNNNNNNNRLTLTLELPADG